MARTGHAAFVFPYACSIPQQKCNSTCTRRNFLASVAMLTISTALPTFANENANPIDLSETEPTLEHLQNVAKESVDLSTFINAAEAGKVSRVWFFGSRSQLCFYQTSEGDVNQIGDGYPIEASRSPESPLHVIARVRNL